MRKDDSVLTIRHVMVSGEIMPDFPPVKSAQCIKSGRGLVTLTCILRAVDRDHEWGAGFCDLDGSGGGRTNLNDCCAENAAGQPE